MFRLLTQNCHTLLTGNPAILNINYPKEYGKLNNKRKQQFRLGIKGEEYFYENAILDAPGGGKQGFQSQA